MTIDGGNGDNLISNGGDKVTIYSGAGDDTIDVGMSTRESDGTLNTLDVVIKYADGAGNDWIYNASIESVLADGTSIFMGRNYTIDIVDGTVAALLELMTE